MNKTDKISLVLEDLKKEVRSHLGNPLPPNELFHYTSAEGLLGMINSHSVWFTNIKFMNDMSELSYAQKLLSTALDRVAHKKPILRNLCEGAKNILALLGAGQGWSIYAFCLCNDPVRRGDRIGLWRGYGKNGHGYAVGFDLSPGRLNVRLSTGQDIQPFYLRLIYAEAEQKQIVNNVIEVIADVFLKLISDKELDTSAVGPELRVFLPRELAPFLLSIKHPAFAEESEWRLVLLEPVNRVLIQHQKFRPYGGYIIPYVECFLTGLDGRDEGRLPLTTVVQGPLAAPEVGDVALKTLLETRGYGTVSILKSTIPWRLGL